MKSRRKKIDKMNRAFHQGYIAAIRGHSADECHHSIASIRGSWLGGWREGREDQRSGFNLAEL